MADGREIERYRLFDAVSGVLALVWLGRGRVGENGSRSMEERVGYIYIYVFQLSKLYALRSMVNDFSLWQYKRNF